MKYMEQDYEKLEKDGYYRGLKEAHEVLTNLSEQECKEFIMKTMCCYMDYRDKFKSNFPQYFKKLTKEEYKQSVSNRIYEIIQKYGKGRFIGYDDASKFSIDATVIIKEADNLAQNKYFQEAFWIISAFLEQLPDLPVDDSMDTLGFLADNCAKVLKEIINQTENTRIATEAKNWAIDVLANESIDVYSYSLEKALK